MSAMLPAKRRAEAFADALDADVRDPRFDVLLEVVGALRAAGDHDRVVPRAGYTLDLRERLMAAAETELVPTDAKLLLPQRSTASGRRQGRLSAAAAAFAVVAGTAGIATASGSSVPGDSLYPFKRGVEAAQQAVSFGDASRGRDKLGQADSRLDEITKMVDGHGDSAQLSETVQSFISQGGDGADLLFRDYDATANTDSVRAVRAFAGTAMTQISALAGTAPASLQPDLAQAASMLSDIDQQASVLCADCGARSPLEPPSDLQLASDQLTSLLSPEDPSTDTTTATGSGDASDSSGSASSGSDDTGDGSSSDPVGDTVNKVVTGAGSGGATTTKNPVGSILGKLPIPLPTATSGVGKVVGDVVNGITGATK